MSAPEPQPLENAVTIRLDLIRPNPRNPRELFDEGALNELALSITRHGVQQPITVRYEPARGGGAPYQIVAGARRFRAAKLAGLDEIPALIVEADANLSQELALVENIQRQDLTALEQAKAVAALMEREGLSINKVARRLGVSQGWITNRTALLKTRPDVREIAARKPLALSSLLLANSIADDDARAGVLKLIDNGAPFKQVEAAVEEYRETREAIRKSQTGPDSETRARQSAAQNGGGQLSRGKQMKVATKAEATANARQAVASAQTNMDTARLWIEHGATVPKAELLRLKRDIDALLL